LARHYLNDPNMSLVDVAFLLGFSEQSPFTKAFKRWTGETPGEYRRHLGQ
ncbi:MAG TPA: AraC family transcriptional regulator, partial [Gammaproteobacteria bacterium]|nr:AraC family transcriptional regulator [Gammaproteobacteria bacterium]